MKRPELCCFDSTAMTAANLQIERWCRSENRSFSSARKARHPGLSRFELYSLSATFAAPCTASIIVAMGQLSGSSVIQNFQNIFYETVGFTGQSSLLISGIYGMMGIIGQVIYLYVVADRWPHRVTLWTGLVTLSVIPAICMALSSQYGSEASGNRAGARAAIAFSFIYSACYAIFNALVWAVPSELFPMFLRSKGLAFAVFTKSVMAIVLSQITPLTLDNVGWRYYTLFIATNTAAALIYFFFLPETGGNSLEDVAELFGDTLATNHIGDIDVSKKAEKDVRVEQTA